MPEHTIPEALVERIRAGRAALVVGAGIGVSTWKQVLERMNDELARRGYEGDEAAAKDVAKLLHKGSLRRAAGFLGRALGEDSCDALLADAWAGGEPPPVARALAKLPLRQVWTTFPGDLLERAMVDGLPAGWPEPRVVTYAALEALDPRRRYVLKLLGDFDNYVVTPTSVRRALAQRAELRALVADLYRDGALIFVGFRFGDPDLAALLDHVLGALEPPHSTHYLIASGVGPVTVDELMAEHRIEVVNLAGKGADDEATAALIEWLEAFAATCAAAGIDLAELRPADDDLEGWIGILFDQPDRADALDKVDAILTGLRAGDDAEALVEALMMRTEVEPVPARRAALLREVAEVFQDRAGDLPRAFTALSAALREDPGELEILAAAESLAGETDAWAELIGDVAAIAGELDDAALAAVYWTRLGRWYEQRLHHYDYAVAAFREAIKRDRARLDAYTGLEEVFRKQQRWAELADTMATHLEHEPDADHRIDLLLSAGDLYETQLASTARAIEAYQAAMDLADGNDDALVALERLYRRDERWGKLAVVLERRAELFAAGGEIGRANVLRDELATLRADKLGDLEGAIAKLEAQLGAGRDDVDTLRKLEDLYEKTGRTADYLRVLERLADVVPVAERRELLRRVATELAEHAAERDRAVAAYRRLLALEPDAEDAFRGLERLYRADANWDALVSVLASHIEAVKAPAPRLELYIELARIYEDELRDPHRAIEALLNALAVQEDDASSLTALARLYQRVEAWDRAVDVLVKQATAAGEGGAPSWHEAGALTLAQLADPDRAEQYFLRALGVRPHFLPAVLGLAGLHERRRNWDAAVAALRDAAHRAQDRAQRIELLERACRLADEQLDDAALALDLQRRILELDPEREDAARRIAARLLADQRWAEAEPILELLARRAADGVKAERARREAELAKVCAALDKHDKAGLHFELALQLDPDSLEAGLGLAAIRYQAAQRSDDEDTWRQVDRRYREILARHRTNLADGDVVEIWHRIGVASRALGDDKKAENAFRRALERDPHHRWSLLEVIEIARRRNDWKTLVEAKRDLIEGAAAEEKARLFAEIGDIYARELGDPVTALGAYLEVTKMEPANHVVLHKTLEIYAAQKQWRRAVETLSAIAATEAKPHRRAKYRYTAAVIARDELKDQELAVDCFHQALDDEPGLPKAFEAVERLLTDAEDWRALARAYRKMLKRVGEDAPTSQLIMLWSRLGEICLDRLGDNEAAIAAFEVASSLEPDDLARHEQLADLYLEAGEDRRDDAIAELQILIQAHPDRVELYRALSELYRAAADVDRAFCLAQALAFLGAANDEERALFERHRPRALKVAKRRLTEELWQKAIIHERENRHLNALFATLVAPIAATTAQPPGAFKLSASERVNTQTDDHTAARVFGYAANILGLDPVPALYIAPDSDDPLRIANTADRGKLAPSVLMGAPLLGNDREGEVAFDVAKKLAYLRPERYVSYALQTLPKIEAAVRAAITAAGIKDMADDLDTKALADQLQRTTPVGLLDQVRAVGAALVDRAHNGLVAGWRSATDLTANRVGLILCNDFETAARAIATEAPGMSTLSAKERLRDLLAYSVSDHYFQVRRHLGLSSQAA
jgi:tetratricopeptide (TPR) repeat protein